MNADGEKSQLDHSDFLQELVNEVDDLSLLQMDGIQPTYFKVS